MNTIEIIRQSNSALISQGLPLGVTNVNSTVTNNNLTGISSLNGLSGVVLLTGAGEATVSVNGQIITVTSISSASAATSGLATSGFCTGISGVLQNQVNILNNNTGNYYLESNPSGYITGFNSGIYITTGQTGQFYPASNPNQYTTSGNLNQTGSNLDSKINSLSGYSNTIFSTVPNLQSTGSNLQSQINSINSNTGQFYLNSNPSQYIRSGDVSSVYSTITNLQSTGTNLQTQINNLNNNTGNYYLNSNEQRIKTILPTGFNFIYIQYNSNFPSIPCIWMNLQTSGNFSYHSATSGISISGYTAIFSDIIRESGNILHSLIKLI